MARKKKKYSDFFKQDSRTGEWYYERQPFETRRAGDARLKEIKEEPHTDLYMTMIQSDAWANLTGGAIKLYCYMKQQAFSKAKNNGRKKGEYELKGSEFYFNKALIKKNCKNLYPSSLNQYYKDKECLIQNGFIEVAWHSPNTIDKDIYKLSDKWQTVERKKRKSNLPKR